MVHLQPGYSYHLHTGSTRGLSLSQHLCSNRGWWVCWVNRIQTNLSPFSLSLLYYSVSPLYFFAQSMTCCLVHAVSVSINLTSHLDLIFHLVFSSTLPFHATVRGSSFDDLFNGWIKKKGKGEKRKNKSTNDSRKWWEKLGVLFCPHCFDCFREVLAIRCLPHKWMIDCRVGEIFCLVHERPVASAWPM